MGMDADVIGIGRFRKTLAKHLDYPEDFYKDTPEGCEIITTIFNCPTTQASQDLARVLGIDPWRFEEHRLVLSQKNLDDLLVFADENSCKEDWEDLQALHIAGFTFYYRPNG